MKKILVPIIALIIVFTGCGESTEKSNSEKETGNSSTTTVATTTIATTTTATTKVTEKSVEVQAQTVEQALSLVSITNHLQRNTDATITIKGKPNTEYNIDVHYSSISTAAGLENAKSDANGVVSWTWQIGGKTNPGNYYINISGGDEQLKVDFTVSE